MQKKIKYLFVFFLLILAISSTACSKKNNKKNEEQIIRFDEKTENIIKENDIEEYRDLIKDNKELFDKYSNAIENNNYLSDRYKKNLYKIFIIVSDKKEYINGDLFFPSLSSIKITVKGKLKNKGASGEYSIENNEISVLPIHQEEDSVIYHELIHFLDYKLNDNATEKYWIYNRKIYSPSDYDKLSSYEQKLFSSKALLIDDKKTFIIEGGAEKYSSSYFSYGMPDSYKPTVALYNILEYIYGSKTMDSIFFGSTNPISLFYKQYDYMNFDFFEAANNITDIHSNEEDEDYCKVLEYIIDFYKKNKGNNINNDETFKLLLYQFLNNTGLVRYKNSKYYNYLINLKNEVESTINNWRNNEFEVNNRHKDYMPTYYVNYLNDTLSIVISNGEDSDNYEYIYMEYNSDENKIVNKKNFIIPKYKKK